MKKALIRAAAIVPIALLMGLTVVLAQAGDPIEIIVGKGATARSQLTIAHGRHFGTDDHEGALAAYRDLLTRFPDSSQAAEARSRIANLYHWELGDPATAIEAYGDVIAHHPGPDLAVEAAIRIGEAYARMNHFDTAMAHFRQVVDDFPDSPYAAMALIDLSNTLMFDMGDVRAASEIYSVIESRYPGTSDAAEAEVALARIASKGPRDRRESLAIFTALAHKHRALPTAGAHAQYLVGQTYRLMMRHDEALAAYEAVVADFPAVHGDMKALALSEAAEVLLASGDTRGSVEQYRAILDAYPNNRWTAHVQRRIHTLLNANPGIRQNCPANRGRTNGCTAAKRSDSPPRCYSRVVASHYILGSGRRRADVLPLVLNRL